jgi:hypothetical protein
VLVIRDSSFITIEMFASRWRVSPTTVLSWIDEGKISAQMIKHTGRKPQWYISAEVADSELAGQFTVVWTKTGQPTKLPVHPTGADTMPHITLDRHDFDALDSLCHALNHGYSPAPHEIELLEAVIQRARVVEQDDLPLSKRIEGGVDYWMHRFHKSMDIYEDTETDLGCWVWTGASQGGSRPVYREQKETRPVRAKMLELHMNYFPHRNARIYAQCHVQNCVRPEHLRVVVQGKTVWPEEGAAPERVLPLPVLDPTAPLDVDALFAGEPEDDQELQILWDQARKLQKRASQKPSTTAVAAYPSVERSTEVTPLDALVFMLSELRDLKRSLERIAALLG